MVTPLMKFVDTLAARYTKVTSRPTEGYSLNFPARKDEVEHELDFECEKYRTYNLPFMKSEFESNVCASGNRLSSERTIFLTELYYFWM